VTPAKALLFDFDGVIADTEPFHWQAWCEALASFSPELDWDTYRHRCVGTSDVQMLRFFTEITAIPTTVDEIRSLYPLKRKLFHSLTSSQSIIDDRLVTFLAGLRNLQLAVVTSSNQVEVEPILEQAGLLSVLNTVVYGNNVTRYKPHPEPYEIALARVGVQASEAVVFEDSPAGIRSGLEANCRVVTVRAPAELLGLVQNVVSGWFPEAGKSA